ncbi:MAG: restriction endonuclease [Planctomycetaceae bacterium]|nr:restriction endonuclease [Planctomycetaceae bacterium]
MKAKRDEYWVRAFAVNSEFDVLSTINGSSIIDLSVVIRQKLIDHFARHPQELYRLPSRSFEELIAELFNGLGYAVELTAATRDNGHDIIAISNTHVGKCKYLIECKRYSMENKVGIVPVRALHGVVSKEKATKGIIVTTSHFTAPANKFIEEEKWALEGHDFEGLLEWLKSYQNLRRK